MAQTIAKYETIFIVNSTLTEEEIAGVVTKFRELIEQNATLDKIDEWGKRRLAYPIDDMHDGYYVQANFTAKPDFPAELDRVYKITDGIMRSLIVSMAE